MVARAWPVGDRVLGTALLWGDSVDMGAHDLLVEIASHTGLTHEAASAVGRRPAVRFDREEASGYSPVYRHGMVNASGLD